ncbi:MAG TPA: hypothetical protein VJY34_05765 [Roseiarcus sp.]|nr:hypothetical protein [Roseiarcus sp.]
MASAVLTSLADGERRGATTARARSILREHSEEAVHAMTEEAARLVDRLCPDQAFPFRATMTLLSMQVADHFAA